MMNTTISLDDLKTALPHFQAIEEEGWSLAWGDMENSCFEVLYKGDCVEQAQRLETLLTEAYAQAREKFAT